MKSFFNTITLVTVMLATSCGPVETDEIVYTGLYYKLYGTFYDDYQTSVFDCGNEEFAISGYYVTLEGTSVGSVYKTDKTGMVEWNYYTKNTYGSTKIYDVFYDSQSQGMVAICGLEIPDSVTCGYVLNLNENGVTDSTGFIIDGRTITNMRIIPQRSGGFIYLAQYVSSKGDIRKAYTYTGNESGDIERSYEIVLDQSVGDDGDIKVKYYEDDKAFITATSLTGGSTNIYLGLLAKERIIWSRLYTANGNITSADIKIVNNNVLIAGGITETGGQRGIYFLETDLTGEKLREKILYAGAEYTIRSYSINDKGNYVFTGSKEKGSGSTLAFFLEVSNNDSIIHENTYGEAGPNFGVYIQNLEGQDKYIILGEMYSLNNSDIFCMKLDKVGKVLE